MSMLRAAADDEHDGRRRRTTADAGAGAAFTEAFYADPVRRYMLPVFSDRRTDWPSHPHATRDSLHEHDMWVAEGLTHRYPTKVLAELLPTCPQYCGHCTRMDLVGNSTPVDRQAEVRPQAGRPATTRCSTTCAARRGVRDVVVSGGDVANMPWKNLEAFLDAAARDREHPRHPAGHQGADGPAPALAAADDVVEGIEPGRDARPASAASRSRSTPTSTTPQSVTPAGGRGDPGDARRRRARRPQPGRADARRQRHDRRSCSTSASRCSTAREITPYYFYMCDMIPFAEHWRVSLAEAQHLQHAIMGYLPGFATPRIVCDVPFVGKRWVHQVARATTPSAASRYWTQELPHLDRGRRRRGAVAATTSTTTRSTRSPTRGRPGGASTATLDATHAAAVAQASASRQAAARPGAAVRPEPRRSRLRRV